MHTDRKNPEVTTAVLLETRVSNKKEKHPVKLRVTYQRKRKYYTIKGEYYTEDEFSKIVGDRPRGTNKEKKRKFESVEERAINIIDNTLDKFSFESFEREYLNKIKLNTTIKSYFDHKAYELDEVDKIQTANLYKSTLVSLLEFDKKMTFQKINPQYLKKYEKWMIKEGNSYTTIGIYLRNFKHILNRAIKDNVINEYPFGSDKDKYSIPKSKNVKKALSLSDIEKLYNSNPQKQNEYLALQYWFFSYLCNGMNMIDIANLKYKNIKGNNLKFVRHKTKDTSHKKPIINVHLLQESIDIIDSIGNKDKGAENYIFPIFKPELTEVEKYNKLRQHIKITNKYIRVIAKRIKINEDITTYWARHSYSTISKRSGASIEFIGEQLGHQSTQVTKDYLDSFEDEHREKYSKELIAFKGK